MFVFETKYMREKKITVGDSYMEVDIIPRNIEDEHHRSGTRSKKENVSAPKQKNLNDKNARRYLVELGNGNFSSDDYHLTLTYGKEEDGNSLQPKSIEEAEKNVTNYLRRVAYRRKKKHLAPLKYILVTEYRQNDEGEFTTKIHHHILINGGLDRDTLEDMWTIKMPGQKRMKLGITRADRLQPDESESGNGIEGILQYLSKDPKGKKRWSSSRNLKRPVKRTNDWKFTISGMLKAKDSADKGLSLFRKKYSKYDVVDRVEWEYNEMTGWHCYLKMWKKSTERII